MKPMFSTPRSTVAQDLAVACKKPVSFSPRVCDKIKTKIMSYELDFKFCAITSLLIFR